MMPVRRLPSAEPSALLAPACAKISLTRPVSSVTLTNVGRDPLVEYETRPALQLGVTVPVLRSSATDAVVGATCSWARPKRLTSMLCCVTESVTTLPLVLTDEVDPPRPMLSGGTVAASAPLRPSTWFKIPLTRPVTGEAPLDSSSRVSSPLRMEHSPRTPLPRATLVGFRARFAGSIAFTVPRKDCTGGDSGVELDPALPEAARTPWHTDDADSDGPPSRLWR